MLELAAISTIKNTVPGDNSALGPSGLCLVIMKDDGCQHSDNVLRDFQYVLL